MVGDESPQGGAGLVMGETLLAECCDDRLGVPVTSDVEETTGVAIPDLLS